MRKSVAVFIAWMMQACWWSPPAAYTQNVTTPLYIFVDTAGIATIGPQQYITWVFARTGPTAPPVSGVLVKFDCAKNLVQRIAHVVYHAGPVPGSTTGAVGVIGEIVADTMGWQTAKDPRINNVVCAKGREHDAQKAKLDAWDKQHPKQMIDTLPGRPPLTRNPGTWKSA